jgi:hypothetical protein
VLNNRGGFGPCLASTDAFRALVMGISALPRAAGFVVAAMWIDKLANELVGLLTFLGILARVDHVVLGMTVRV